MLRLQLAGMSCGHCVKTVTNAVKAAEPDATVSIDLSAKLVEVDGASDPDSVVQALRDAGYSPVALN